MGTIHNANKPVPIYHVHQASVPIRIDGRLDEFDWLRAKRISFVKFAHDPEDHKALRESTQMMALWDKQNLYLAFVISDREIWATLQNRDARLFPEECVEFFLDPDGDGRRYIEAQINSVNNIRDLLVDGSLKNPTYPQYDKMARWDFQHLHKAVRIYQNSSGDDLGWILELAIPWSEFAFSRKKWPPLDGATIRANFYRYERSRTSHLPLELSGWSKVEGDFHQPARFGTFVFVMSPVGSENATH